MKKFFCIVALAMVCLMASAKPISQEQARQRAAAFLKQRNDLRELAPVSPARLAPRRAASLSAEQPYYVFERGTNEGFVIVSGDDQTIDVLGYSEDGTFDYEQAPPALRELLDDYARQIEMIQAGKSVAAPVVKAANRKAIAPFVKSKWSQGAPYNNKCPLDAGSRSVTGCVATAMAQILYYNREKSVTETQADMPAYSTWTKGLKVSGIAAGAPIDWDNMKDTYGSSDTEKQKTAVANLMLYCGVGSKMDYTNSASGAQSWDAYQAMKNYFGYSSAKWYDYQSVTSNEQWDEIVYNEMAAQRAVYISGSNATVGHAFVGCGYDGTRYYINWGWAGQSDGYYYLTNLTPGQGQGTGGSADGYNEYKQIITNLEPENYEAKVMSFADAAVKRLCVEKWDADGDGKFTYGEAAKVIDLGDTFKGKTIKNFKELYYFTELSTIADDAFNGCQQLVSVRLPKSIRHIGARSFMGCQKMNQLDISEGLQTIGEDAFNGCKLLTSAILPAEASAIPARAFKGCSAITEVSLPVSVTSIGDDAFADCTKLTSFEVSSFQPSGITMGTSVFGSIDLSKATLSVMPGTKVFFASAEQWKEFGNIVEKRERSGGNFATLEAGKTYYIYNVGTGRYLTKGEAYGKQAVVGEEPMRFDVKTSASLGENVYYLSSPDTGVSGKYLFRTSTDNNVGAGVKACFVDGSSLNGNAYWQIVPVGDLIYTLQTPSNRSDYEEGRFLGIQTDHKSNAASPTFGAYSDVVYAEHPLNCQWRFVLYDEATAARYEAAEKLASLLEIAIKNSVNHSTEQAVYDNIESSYEQLREAVSTLRKKLNFIDFASDEVRALCVARYDLDYDEELSMAEAANVTDFVISFENNKTLETFDEFQYFTNVQYVYGRTFYGCANLKSITLPKNLEKIYYYAFYGCRSLTSVTLPRYVNTIGANSFGGCTALAEVRIEGDVPFAIETTVFGTKSADAFTIYVPFGEKENFESADVWKNYTIKEMRGYAKPKRSSFAVDKPGYFVNVATGKMMSKGEAYGTQSVVDHNGMVYQMKRIKSMPEGQYYFYSNNTGKDGKVLFRVSTDSKVGEGVKACFVDGSLKASAYWKVDSVDTGIYIFSVPETDEEYVEGQHMGVDENHESSAASPTYGIYWDLYGTEPDCQWAFIAEEDMKAAKEFDALANQLKLLLETAAQQEIDAQSEQLVYDNAASTADDMETAISSLRDKLHFITFVEEQVRKACLANWDANGDEELSYEEAADVNDIGEVFRGISNVKQISELRYFTSLKSIPENAFRGASALQTVVLPENVDTIGKYAFFSTGLHYLVLLNNKKKVPFGSSSVPGKSTVFVPANMIDEYMADEQWTSKSMITEYTGKPVVTVNASREYGRKVATANVIVLGAPIDGTPEYVCDAIAEPSQPVGEYPVIVSAGTVTTPDATFQDGVLTIVPATLTITAKNCQRNIGEENPVFEVEYKGFRNSETEEVLIAKPVLTCSATADSPAGEYEITVGSAEAANYTITYVSGVLTVVDPAGVHDLSADRWQSDKVTDLQGRKVNTLKRGIYIVGNKKVLVK